MCLNLSNHQLKIDFYMHGMLYMNFIVITKIYNIQKRKRKATKHNTKESPQIRREENKTIRKPNKRTRLRPHLP